MLGNRRLVWSGPAALLWCLTLAPLAPAAPRPNVVIIVTDDHGYGDIGWNNPAVKTPHLDRLAADGARLERMVVNPICSVTRAALLTGLATARTGVNNSSGLDLKYRILPQAFHDAGYQTWMCGKWHLGGPEDSQRSGPQYLPQARGFDSFYGLLGGAIDYTTHERKETGQLDWQRNGQPIREEGFSTDLLADEASRLVRGRQKQQPFLLYLAFNAVHGPLAPPPSAPTLSKRDRRPLLLANLTHLDAALGRVLATLDAEGLRNDTLVFFCGDNGGQLNQGASNGTLRGEKGGTFEGGIRVPAAIRWPGQIKAGQVSRQLMAAMDLLPTLCAAAGVATGIGEPLDGVNLWPALTTGRVGKHPPFVMGNKDVACFSEPWKLVVPPGGEAPLLFDIQADPAESRDLAAAHPEIVATLEREIAAVRGPGGKGGNRKPEGGTKGKKRGGTGGKASADNAPPASSAAPASQSKTAGRPPNVVFILADDLGWRDTGFAGNRFAETPRLDRLAREGVVFRQAYASAPNCAPTRACLLTGQYTPRHGVYTVVDERHDPGQPAHQVIAATSQAALPESAVTIATLLKSKGYATGCYGMWNLGRGRSGPGSPLGQGFDVYQQPRDLGFAQNTYRDEAGRYLVNELTSAALEFVETHRQQPFFLYLATHDVHAPLDPQPDLLEKYQRKLKSQSQGATTSADDPAYAATIEALDTAIGTLLDRLTAWGLAENTLVVFTSDNGGTPEYTLPLNGSKGTLYEGGLRVPCVAWGAGVVHPGRTTDEPILSMDWYPTLAALAGAELPKNVAVDGQNLMPILADTGPLERPAVFWHFPCYVGRGEPSSAVRMGEFKLIEKFGSRTVELYNLRDDPGEAHDLSQSQPALAKRLATSLRAWQQGIRAPRPETSNPAYDPATQRREYRKRPAERGS